MTKESPDLLVKGTGSAGCGLQSITEHIPPSPCFLMHTVEGTTAHALLEDSVSLGAQQGWGARNSFPPGPLHHALPGSPTLPAQGRGGGWETQQAPCTLQHRPLQAAFGIVPAPARAGKPKGPGPHLAVAPRCGH